MSRSPFNMISTCRVLAAAGAVALAASAWSQTDTGPAEQRLPWRVGGGTLNSVVQVHSRYASGANGYGTGTVIDKHVDPRTGDGWLCVLTADHVVGRDTTHGAVTHVRAGFGDATGAFTADNAQGVFGGAVGGGAGGARVYRGKRAPGSGGLGGVDIALVMIRYGTPDAFFGGISKATLAPWNPGPVGTTLGGPLNQFTEVGYGGSGTFVAGGLNFAAADGKKRFQNNTLERVVQVRGGGYNYAAVEWDFDRAAAQAKDPVTGVPLPAIAQPFLVAEGLSYRGDSGGPYFNYAGPMGHQAVAQILRPGANNWDWKDPAAVPPISAEMPLRTDMLFAVHTRGNSSENRLGETGFSPYTNFGAVPAVHTWGAGVPITPAYAAWIHGKCHLVPTPGSLALLAFGGLVAAHRRRR